QRGDHTHGQQADQHAGDDDAPGPRSHPSSVRHAGRDTNPDPGPEPLAGPYRLHYGSAMGELRLYAIGIDEVRGMFGARPDEAQRLREIAARALEPEPVAPSGGLLSRLGPIFRRPPGAPVISPTQPQPADLEALLAGDR